MVDVTKIYPSYDDDEFLWGWSDYEPMVKAFGNAVIVVEDNDYQGDTRVLYDNDGVIGHLVFGWGSCSGCDALQACNSFTELQELCNHLENSIKWFDSAKEALHWFNNRDWELQWEWHEEETKSYVLKAINYLAKKAGETE